MEPFDIPEVRVTAPPRGRKGLWAALARGVTTPSGPPLVVLAEVAPPRGMFDVLPGELLDLEEFAEVEGGLAY